MISEAPVLVSCFDSDDGFLAFSCSCSSSSSCCCLRAASSSSFLIASILNWSCFFACSSDRGVNSLNPFLTFFNSSSFDGGMSVSVSDSDDNSSHSPFSLATFLPILVPKPIFGSGDEYKTNTGGLNGSEGIIYYIRKKN